MIWRVGVAGNLPRFRLRGCRGKKDKRDLARGCCGETWRVGVAGNPRMIWRAEDAVRARKMNGSGETEGACEGALETHTTHLKAWKLFAKRKCI